MQEVTIRMDEIKNKVPTHEELRAIIEKIAEFFKAFIAIFDDLKAGLSETFSEYKRQY